MSGGSWDYACYKFDEVADKLLEQKDIKRKTLGKLVELIAKAIHDIEWVDSGDCSPGDEIEAIDKALGFNGKTNLKETAKEEIEELKKMLEAL